MKKKIVQVLPAFNVGGAEMLVKEYLLNIDRSTYDAEALVLGERKHSEAEKSLEEQGVKITFLSERYSTPSLLPWPFKKIVVAYRWRSELIKYFKYTKPDYVHCHLSVANRLCVATHQLKKAKLFYTLHSDPIKYFAGVNGEKESEW